MFFKSDIQLAHSTDFVVECFKWLLVFIITRITAVNIGSKIITNTTPLRKHLKKDPKSSTSQQSHNLATSLFDLSYFVTIFYLDVTITGKEKFWNEDYCLCNNLEPITKDQSLIYMMWGVWSLFKLFSLFLDHNNIKHGLDNYMIIHHILTIILIFGSAYKACHKFGLVVMYTHDFVEVIYSVFEVADNLEMNSTLEMLIKVAFGLTWIYTRNYMFAKPVWSWLMVCPQNDFLRKFLAYTLAMLYTTHFIGTRIVLAEAYKLIC